MSGLGKGLLAASLAKLLKESGFSVLPLKFDGYLNIDAGTINPFKHGEVFVLDDGTETDMDLGEYERFLNLSLDAWSSLTGGRIFHNIIEKERKGEFLGEDIQFIPHVTQEVISWVQQKDKSSDITLIEVGGTVGDIENAYFIEALRQLSLEVRQENITWIHVTLIPILNVVGQQKTKPTQASVKTLQGMGVQPNILLCRAKEKILEETRSKIAMFCNVQTSDVISGHDIENIYEYPFELLKEEILTSVFNKLQIGPKRVPSLSKWQTLVENMKNLKNEVTIGIGGKYTDLEDAYVSITKAITHTSAHLGVKINIKFIETTELNEEAITSQIQSYEGVIIPGGFGNRGISGKIALINKLRVQSIPFLGICLGLQCAVIEYARNECGLKSANSTEFDANTPYPVIDLLPTQQKVYRKGGTMRLGGYPVKIKENTLAHSIYHEKKNIRERFRHRYEVNPDYISKLKDQGMVFSGKSIDGEVIHIIELPNHPFFIGTQFHPEFLSRFEKPSNLFTAFIQACVVRKAQRK